MSGLTGSPCYDLLSCSPPLQETFTFGLSTARSPSPLPDMTTVATGQFPPAGLTPAGPTTSVAAQLPCLLPESFGFRAAMGRSSVADIQFCRWRAYNGAQADVVPTTSRYSTGVFAPGETSRFATPSSASATAMSR